MKNGQKSSLYGETSLYSEEIPYSELFSKIHYIEYPLYPEIKHYKGSNANSSSKLLVTAFAALDFKLRREKLSGWNLR